MGGLVGYPNVHHVYISPKNTTPFAVLSVLGRNVEFRDYVVVNTGSYVGMFTVKELCIIIDDGIDLKCKMVENRAS